MKRKIVTLVLAIVLGQFSYAQTASELTGTDLIRILEKNSSLGLSRFPTGFWNYTNLAQHGVYMDEAEVCDRIGFIYEGKIISIDTPDGHFEKTGLDNLEDIFITYELKKTPSSEVISYKNMKSSIRGTNNEKL